MITPLLQSIFKQLEEELGNAKRKHPDYPSMHHGLAVIREEYLEFEEIVFTNNQSLHLPEIKKECLQLASSCIRFLMDSPELSK